MNVDPRIMKELLQLELLGKSSLLSGGAAAGEEAETSDFAGMLQELMGTTSTSGATGDTAKASSAAARTAFKPGISPFMFDAQDGAQDAGKYASGKRVDYEAYIQQASRQYGVPSSLVKAVIEAESSFNPRAVSRAGAKGLMQLMDGTAQGFGVTDSFDPQQNINAGTQYLANLLVKYNGNEGMALAAYNAGSGRVNRLGVSSDREMMDKLHMLPEETRHYVRRVLGLKQNYTAGLS
ncbi:lytic transglycosylase domain-containing protein [Paenibacillus hamazuiensis]|uniref:lytic transglycosylase domain-containing protein n=1 Tax=Paenibacillus hamazuiensis TaxID=2936508 RepID=UPI00200CFE60|nr:lytic transglycosylase domain-containing protein [Paenibacillus hamazuiensis]